MAEFVRKNFPDSVIVPKCFTDGQQFCVSQFLEKQIANGDAEAKKWYYSMGELSAMVKIRNSITWEEPSYE